MIKFKVFPDFKEEELYLNEMAQRGHFLKKHSAFGFYHFSDGAPKELHYHVDCRKFKTRADFEDYKALFEDAGWQHVFGTRYSLNQYFLAKNSKTNDDIFSTKDSAALRYKHLYEMCYANVILAIAFFIAVLISCDFNLANIAFLTPGLGELTGAKFWRAFLFELPFVLFRTIPIAFFLVMAIAYAVWGGQAKRIYYKMMRNTDW